MHLCTAKGSTISYNSRPFYFAIGFCHLPRQTLKLCSSRLGRWSKLEFQAYATSLSYNPRASFVPSHYYKHDQYTSPCNSSQFSIRIVLPIPKSIRHLQITARDHRWHSFLRLGYWGLSSSAMGFSKSSPY